MSSKRRGKACQQRRNDARRREINDRVHAQLPSVGYQEDGSYISTNDIMKMLNDREYVKFNRVVVRSDALYFDDNNQPLVADDYECTCNDFSLGLCSVDFCVKRSTIRKLPTLSFEFDELSEFLQPLERSSMFGEGYTAQALKNNRKQAELTQETEVLTICDAPLSDSALCSPCEEPVNNNNNSDVNISRCAVNPVPHRNSVRTIGGNDAESPTLAHEVVTAIETEVLTSLDVITLTNDLPVVVPIIESTNAPLHRHSDLLIGDHVQFIYSGPGCGKTTLKEIYPHLYDTDDDTVFPAYSTVLTNRWDLLMRFYQPYHLVHLPSRAVWNARCKARCLHWRSTWYDDVQKLGVFFKMKSDRYLSDILGFYRDQD